MQNQILSEQFKRMQELDGIVTEQSLDQVYPFSFVYTEGTEVVEAGPAGNKQIFLNYAKEEADRLLKDLYQDSKVPRANVEVKNLPEGVIFTSLIEGEAYYLLLFPNGHELYSLFHDFEGVQNLPNEDYERFVDYLNTVIRS